MISLVDTHCHIQELLRQISPTYDKWYSDHEPRSFDGVIAAAHNAAVYQMLCVGTSLDDSRLAVETAATNEGLYAVVGIHPHEASNHLGTGAYTSLEDILRSRSSGDKIVGIGEIGLDYYYNHSPRRDQITLLRYQIELALTYSLPISFHVREAFDDFWPIFDSYKGIRGVLHSFTDDERRLEEALGRGLFIGVNGIATFGNDPVRSAVNRQIPANRLLLETDAPYLTPKPFRGKICEPKHVRTTAEFLANLRDETLEKLAATSTANAKELFALR